jgi:hypothetical protein
MPGFVPGISFRRAQPCLFTEMAGTSPAMTARFIVKNNLEQI